MPSGWPENDGVSLNPNAPRGLGICDDCGRTYHLTDLRYQFQWGGDRLINLNLRVCQSCQDVPQMQLRSIILPGDPKPLRDPRPPSYTTPGTAEYLQWVTNLNGFNQYTFQLGAISVTKANVLAAAEATDSGQPVPAGVDDVSGTLLVQNTIQRILGPNPQRNYLIIFNPNTYPMVISQGVPDFGSPSSVVLGNGTCLIQNGETTQPPAAIWQGSIFAKSQGNAMPYFMWEGVTAPLYSLNFTEPHNSMYIAATGA